MMRQLAGWWQLRFAFPIAFEFCLAESGQQFTKAAAEDSLAQWAHHYGPKCQRDSILFWLRTGDHYDWNSLSRCRPRARYLAPPSAFLVFLSPYRSMFVAVPRRRLQPNNAITAPNSKVPGAGNTQQVEKREPGSTSKNPSGSTTPEPATPEPLMSIMWPKNSRCHASRIRAMWVTKSALSAMQASSRVYP